MWVVTGINTSIAWREREENRLKISPPRMTLGSRMWFDTLLCQCVFLKDAPVREGAVVVPLWWCLWTTVVVHAVGPVAFFTPMFIVTRLTVTAEYNIIV